MPEISVIVPVYNTEKYLRRCVDSILEQTFEDFEVILVDDGSTDSSGAICDEYAKKDKRVHAFHQSNQGVSAARNYAIQIAEGNMLCFCDSDDYALKEWLSSLRAAFLQFPNALIVCNHYNCFTNKPCLAADQVINEDLKAITYYEMYKKNLSGFVWNKIFDAELVRKNGISFEDQRKIGEDVLFVAEYLRYVTKIIYISHPLYYYNRDFTGRYIWNMLEMQLPLFSARYYVMEDCKKSEYSELALNYYMGMFSIAFDRRNTMPFWQKMKYSQRMWLSNDFRFCVRSVPQLKYKKKLSLIVRQPFFILFWILVVRKRYLSK